MRLYSLNVATGQAFDLAAFGDYVLVRSSAVDLIIENPESGEKIEVSQGDDFQFDRFSSLRISHSSGADQAIKLIISTGKKAGSAKVGGSVTIAGNVGALAQGRASVTNVNQVIRNANPARKYFMVQNNDPVAVLRVNLAGAAATAAQGFRVQPGGVLELQNYQGSAAIYCIMETATAAAGNVEFLEG